MLKIFVLVAAIGLAAAAFAPKGSEGDCRLTEATVRGYLNKVLGEENAQDVVEVHKCTMQVVAGLKYKIDYKTSSGTECTVSWVLQPWTPKEVQDLSIGCN